MADEQVDIDERRRREINELEAKLSTANHFEILGVAVGATPEEVTKAFHELSRRFHPDRFFGKKLGSYGPRLERIFRRLSEANSVLSDPDRRRAWLDANPGLRAQVASAAATRSEPPSPEAAARDTERRSRLARHPYLAKATKVQDLMHRAREAMAKGEYSHAFTHLNLASQVDPDSGEVKQLLGEVRRLNDRQRSEADYKRALELLAQEQADAATTALRAAVAANAAHAPAAARLAQLLSARGADPKEASLFAQKAVDAEPRNVEYRLLLARSLEAAGMKAMARRHLDEALRLDPNHPEVKKHAKRRWPF